MTSHLGNLVQIPAERNESERFLIGAMLNLYSESISNDLSRRKSIIEECLAKFMDGPKADEAVEQIDFELNAWRKLVEPLQISEANQGLDEPNSKELAEIIRTKCIEISKEREEYGFVIDITALALKAFKILPGINKQLQDDISQLKDLFIEDNFKSLICAIDDAQKSEFPNSERHVGSSIRIRMKSPIRAVYSHLDDILEHEQIESNVKLNAICIVRNLAIHFYNEKNDIQNSRAITQFLIERRYYLNDDIFNRLIEDLKTLQNNENFDSLILATKNGKLNEAAIIIERLRENGGHDTDATNLIDTIEKNIFERRSKRNVQIWAWIIVIFGIIVLVLFGSNNQSAPTYEPPSAFSTDVSSAEASADGGAIGQFAASDMPAAPMTQADSSQVSTEAASGQLDETPPAPSFTEQTVNLPELRYCRRQKERLDFAKELPAAGDQITRFNAAVQDYNARCAALRYLESDMSTVEREITNDRAKLTEQGRAIIGDDR